MKKWLVASIILLCLMTCNIPSISNETISNGGQKESFRDSPPKEEWNRTYYNPAGYTFGNCVQVTPDDGYVVTGNAGYGYWYDVYLLKIDSQGNELWNKTFGNQSVARYDVGYWVEVTSDNGYIVTGNNCRIYSNERLMVPLYSDSNPTNDMTISPEKNRRDRQIYGFDNMYPVHPVWFNSTDPGTLHEIGDSSANDYICAGTWADEKWYVSAYYGGLYTVDPITGEMTQIGGSTQLNGIGYVDMSNIMYGCDNTNLYIVDRDTGETTLIGPMNNAGMMTDMAADWNGIAYGVDGVDNNLYSIDLSTGVATIIGPTDVSCEYAGMMYDKAYDVLYLTTYSGVGKFYTVDVTTGHATLVGTFESGDEVEGLAIHYDGVFYQYDEKVWLIKTDTNGNELWNKTYSFGQGLGQASGACVKQTKDGGYIITGNDASRLLLIKTDGVGNELWNKTYGNDSYGSCLDLTMDGGYIITGGCAPGQLLLLKTNDEGVVEWERKFFSPPVTFGSGREVQQTSDGGYIIAGTSSNDDWSTELCLLKTDGNGNEQWNRTFGNHGWDEWNRGYSVIETNDGDYVMGGTKLGLQGHIPDTFRLIRTHSDGSIVWDQLYLSSFSAQCRCVRQTPDFGFIATGARDIQPSPYCIVLKIGDNQAPSPPTITGPTQGNVGESYSYILNATDPENDPVYYAVDWGDTFTEWIGPFTSGVPVMLQHAWNQTDQYTVFAYTKDCFDHESNWSKPFIVSILQRAFLIGSLHNVTISDEYLTFIPTRVFALWFAPFSIERYSFGLMIIATNYIGMVKDSFILGFFHAAIVTNSSTSVLPYFCRLFP